MSDVTTIPTQFKAPPHLFEDHVYRPEQTERTCKVCGITKITTVDGAREWRLADGALLGDVAPAPVCQAVGDNAPKA